MTKAITFSALICAAAAFMSLISAGNHVEETKNLLVQFFPMGEISGVGIPSGRAEFSWNAEEMSVISDLVPRMIRDGAVLDHVGKIPESDEIYIVSHLESVLPGEGDPYHFTLSLVDSKFQSLLKGREFTGSAPWSLDITYNHRKSQFLIFRQHLTFDEEKGKYNQSYALSLVDRRALSDTGEKAFSPRYEKHPFVQSGTSYYCPSRDEVHSAGYVTSWDEDTYWTRSIDVGEILKGIWKEKAEDTFPTHPDTGKKIYLSSVISSAGNRGLARMSDATWNPAPDAPGSKNVYFTFDLHTLEHGQLFEKEGRRLTLIGDGSLVLEVEFEEQANSGLRDSPLRSLRVYESTSWKVLLDAPAGSIAPEDSKYGPFTFCLSENSSPFLYHPRLSRVQEFSGVGDLAGAVTACYELSRLHFSTFSNDLSWSFLLKPE